MYGLYLLVPVFAWLGYREAAKFAKQNGRPPWGLHPGFWALFTGASLLIGGILLIIARRTTAPAIGQAPGYPPGYPTGGQPQGNGQNYGQAYGAPAPPPPGTQPTGSPGPYDSSRNILPGG